MRLVLSMVAMAGLLPAQSLRMYSEFVRLDAAGKLLEPERPREILSPAVARNAYASFRLALTVPESAPAFLYFQQNPEVFEITVYRDHFGKGLEKVALPYSLYEPAGVFWVDVWVPATARVERVRVEALAKMGDRWLLYPMEVRVTGHVVPQRRPSDPPSARRNIAQDLALAKALKLQLPASGPGVEGHLKVRDFILSSAPQ